MKKDFLTGLGIDEETAAKIMAENGRDITREQNKFADYADVKAELEKAQSTIAGFGDVEAIKADVEKYKSEAAQAKLDAETKITALERTQQVRDFTNGKKFVNDITRDAVCAKLTDMLAQEASKGKSLDDLFTSIIDGKTNVLTEDAPKPPVQLPMDNPIPAPDKEDTARAIMGLPPKK